MICDENLKSKLDLLYEERSKILSELNELSTKICFGFPNCFNTIKHENINKLLSYFEKTYFYYFACIKKLKRKILELDEITLQVIDCNIKIVKDRLDEKNN